MAADHVAVENRLLLGDNEGRRMQTLMSTFFAWANGGADGEAADGDSEASPAASSEATLLKLNGILDVLGLAVDKAELMADMSLREVASFGNLYTLTGEQIEQCSASIETDQAELAQAQRIRKNRQEYDALAGVIQQHPSRQDTIREIEELNGEIRKLEEDSSALQLKLQTRQKQFGLLMHAIGELRQTLDAERKAERAAADSPTAPAASSAAMDTS